MSGDPIDEFGARLFQAARQEQPPAAGERRALEAALLAARERPASGLSNNRRLWVFGFAAALLLAAAAPLLLRREAPTDRISAEPASSFKMTRSAPSAADSVAPLPAASVVASAVKRSVGPGAPAPSAAASLSDELSELKVASNALGAGDTRAALAALDRYDHVLKGSKLRAEATMLRIQALASAGDASGASTLAQRFVDHNPESPLVDRARSFIRQPGSGGIEHGGN